MQRVNDIKKWKHVAAGGAMNFSNDLMRRLRLDVNTAGRATLYYVDGDGESTLLACVEGRDVIEFASHGGSFSIVVENADIWVYTVDGEDLSFSLPDAVKFTKVMERRTRNPEVEMMQYMMRHNQRVMLEQQEQEFARMRAEFKRDNAAAATQPKPAGDVVDAAAKPEPDGGAGSSAGDPPADGADGGAAAKKK